MTSSRGSLLAVAGTDAPPWMACAMRSSAAITVLLSDISHLLAPLRGHDSRSPSAVSVPHDAARGRAVVRRGVLVAAADQLAQRVGAEVEHLERAAEQRARAVAVDGHLAVAPPPRRLGQGVAEGLDHLALGVAVRVAQD